MPQDTSPVRASSWLHLRIRHDLGDVTTAGARTELRLEYSVGREHIKRWAPPEEAPSRPGKDRPNITRPASMNPDCDQQEFRQMKRGIPTPVGQSDYKGVEPKSRSSCVFVWWQIIELRNSINCHQTNGLSARKATLIGSAGPGRDRQSRILNFQDGPTRREGNGRRGNWDAALKLGTCVKQHSAGEGLRPAAEVKRALVETEALPESYRRAHLDLDQRLDRPPLAKRAAAGSGTRTWESCDACRWTRDSWISPTGAAGTAWALQGMERHYAGQREPLMGPLAAGRSRPARAQR
ncbi:hypothetical protein NDU88_003236 [Pleurodeles waltl]|uniref:Uncharacterized protein n=1 Tax=Pleurodeles waltl TaxID=8319 RepID=A0AAV7VCT1_PLEWA|nr:hypothetical protein NDU88_003236 [Pleurodeles waltl]